MFRLSIRCPRCHKEAVVFDALDAAFSFRCEDCDELTVSVQKIAGFVYILSNGSMPGLVKIGFTERSVSERISELSDHTGVAEAYKEVASFPVVDPVASERLVHSRLPRYRVNPNREFFRMSVDDAVAMVRDILELGRARIAKRIEVKRAPVEAPIYRENLGGFGSARYDQSG